MPWRFAAVLVVTVALGGAGATPSAPQPEPEQEPRRVSQRALLGAFQPPSPWEGMGTFHELEGKLNAPLWAVHQFVGWGTEWPHPDPSVVQAAGDEGRKVLLTWEPWDHAEGVDQPEFRPDRIAAGDHDEYVRQVARILDAIDVDIYLRPLHEFNGNWYPWAMGRPEVEPDDVVAAWRHLHEVFQDEGATDVAWVWSPNHVDIGSPAFEEAWPGEDTVDVIGIDGYNWGGGPEGPWRSFEELFDDAYERVTRLAPDLPVWLAEVASAEQGGSKAAWIDQMMSSGSYPNLEVVVWFNEDKERRWPIDSSEESLAAMASHLVEPDHPDEVPVDMPNMDEPEDVPDPDEPAEVETEVPGVEDPDAPDAEEPYVDPDPPDDEPDEPGERVRNVRRLAGGNRFATAAAVADQIDGGPAWVASGGNFPDALSGGAAAAATEGVLLLAADPVPQETKEQAAPREAIVVGGRAAVSNRVVNQLDARRVAGANRFDTAAALAEVIDDQPDEVIVASGSNWADAVVAGAQGVPVLLTGATSLPDETSAALRAAEPSTVRIVGGPGVVTRQVAREIRELLPGSEVERNAGADRFETAADYALTQHPDGADTVVVATGSAFADALAAAPLAGANDAPVLLTGSRILPTPTADAIHRLDPDRILIVGGRGPVPAAIADELQRIPRR